MGSDESKGAGGRSKAEADGLAPDIRARYGWDIAGFRISGILRKRARPLLAGEKCLSLANDLMQRWARNDGTLPLNAPFLGNARVMVGGFDGRGISEAKAPPRFPEADAGPQDGPQIHSVTAREYITPSVNARVTEPAAGPLARKALQKTDAPSTRPASKTEPAAGPLARKALQKTDAPSTRPASKTEPDNRPRETGRIERNAAPTPATSSPRRSRHAHQSAQPENPGGNTGGVSDRIDGGSSQKACTGPLTRPVAPDTAPSMHDNGAPFVMLKPVNVPHAGKSTRGVAHAPESPGTRVNRESSLTVGQEGILPVSVQSIARDKRSVMRSLSNRRDMVLPQTRKQGEIKQATPSSDAGTGRRTHGEGTSINGMPTYPVERSIAESGGTAPGPLVLARKPVAGGLLRDTAGVEAEAADMAAHGPAREPGGTSPRSVSDTARNAAIPGRPVIPTAPAKPGAQGPLHDARHSVMARMTAHTGMPLSTPLSLPLSGRDRSFFSAVQSVGVSPDHRHLPFLMRNVRDSGFSPVADITDPYRDEQRGVERGAGIGGSFLPFIGHATRIPPGGPLSAPEIRTRSGDGLPLARSARERGRVLPDAAHGQLTEMSTGRDAFAGILQRSPGPGGQAAHGEASSPAAATVTGDNGRPSNPPPDVGREESVNLERIADQVYAIIERRLVLEKERRGL